jgi:hypothetical protein
VLGVPDALDVGDAEAVGVGDDVGEGLSETDGRGLGVGSGVGLGAAVGEVDTSGVGVGDALGASAVVSGDTAAPGPAASPIATRALMTEAAIQVVIDRMPTSRSRGSVAGSRGPWSQGSVEAAQVTEGWPEGKGCAKAVPEAQPGRMSGSPNHERESPRMHIEEEL